MQINNSRIVLTGAVGGMGSILARALHAQGARLALVDANAEALEVLAKELDGTFAASGDLSSAAACKQVADQCLALLDGVDMLINLAGVNSFTAFEDESPEKMELMMHVNLLAPMWLTRAFLPAMQQQNSGQLVNVGSIFGSIGFAYFTTYSASKFALRGFSEALRRELADTAIKVSYIAPRAVKTPMNSDAVMRMGEATGMNMDEPEAVVAKIIEAIESDKKDAYFGFPESLFVRVNALLPRVVDGALAAQNRIARAFAKGEK
ncbi:dehydrogenase/reductase SDR family member 7B [Mariprofundus micogutta]|uniref:Dehydrogenase/reductase SDR family member 7B n=1 Tax=Mariprofundus micogutta TaxID=1921010 RepID=A0A1L8CR31_9PROT|nr:SDR family oxidoreductase [Mariprofundus micogutta]GAV21357.1 dehydrogenase/reductase SDR family member 7B [Mariprofundus micogutta]